MLRQRVTLINNHVDGMSYDYTLSSICSFIKMIESRNEIIAEREEYGDVDDISYKSIMAKCIKSEVCSAEDMLQALERLRFIERYLANLLKEKNTADMKRYKQLMEVIRAICLEFQCLEIANQQDREDKCPAEVKQRVEEQKKANEQQHNANKPARQKNSVKSWIAAGVITLLLSLAALVVLAAAVVAATYALPLTIVAGAVGLGCLMKAGYNHNKNTKKKQQRREPDATTRSLSGSSVLEQSRDSEHSRSSRKSSVDLKVVEGRSHWQIVDRLRSEPGNTQLSNAANDVSSVVSSTESRTASPSDQNNRIAPSPADQPSSDTPTFKNSLRLGGS